MNKAEKEYCNNCNLHNHCWFVSRGMEDGCSEMAAFSLGYEKVIENAAEWLDGCIPDYIDLKHANVDTFMNVDNKRFIEDFKKEMEE